MSMFHRLEWEGKMTFLVDVDSSKTMPFSMSFQTSPIPMLDTLHPMFYANGLKSYTNTPPHTQKLSIVTFLSNSKHSKKHDCFFCSIDFLLLIFFLFISFHLCKSNVAPFKLLIFLYPTKILRLRNVHRAGGARWAGRPKKAGRGEQKSGKWEMREEVNGDERMRGEECGTFAQNK